MKTLGKKLLGMLCTLLLLLQLAVLPAAQAAPQPIWLEINQAYLFQAGDSPIVRVTVANPAIADVVVLDDAKLNFIGKALGSTSISVWSENEMRQDFVVSVCNADTATAQYIRQAMGLHGVQVSKVGDKLVLQGVVENQYEMNNALGIAKVYAEEANIVNLIQMKNPTMVNLSALVIDISGKDSNNLGFKYGVASGYSTEANQTTITFGTAGEFYGGMDYNKLNGPLFQNVDVMIQALATQNKLKVLSRPNITTMSGEEAEILIGGEIPIPTTKDGEVTITWKTYGIKLKIKPIVDHENKITSKIEAEVSGIDNSLAISTTAGQFPALISRKASTMLSVPDGQTMAIGGLMNSDESKVITKIPILGDIPIIGEFFKHTSTSKDKRELMILITPTVVTSNDPVKGTNRMLKTVEESKRAWQEMQEIYPNDPPMSEKEIADLDKDGNKEATAKADRVQETASEQDQSEAAGPLYKKRDTSKAPSWTEKAEAELREQNAQAAAANQPPQQ